MPTVPDPLVEPLENSQMLADILASVTNTTPADARARLQAEEKQPGFRIGQEMRQAQIRPHQWTDELLEFYGTTEGFLYECTVWNRSSEKLRLRRWIAQYLSDLDDRPKRILCYGDGLGFDSLYLNLAGHQTDYFEVSEPNRNYAKQIYALNNQPFHECPTKDAIPHGVYDAIVCLDVLEHVPDPPSVIKEFTQYLNQDGRLIVNAPFYLVNSLFPTHLDVNRRYCGNFQELFGRFGYRMLEGCLFWNPIVVGRSHCRPRKGIPGRTGVLTARCGGMLLSGARVWAAPYGWLCRTHRRLSGNPWIAEMENRSTKT